MMKLVTSILLCMFANTVLAVDVTRVEPPNWWVGFEQSEFQLMLYGEGIANTEPRINHANIVLKRVERVTNPNYLFLYLDIAKQHAPTTFNITLNHGENSKTITYSLLQKTHQPSALSGKDVIYLITPDRFANGDLQNDNLPEYLEAAQPNFAGGRFGGDFKGIEQALDGLKTLGVSMLWLNPVLENNMPSYSYHGYAITDLYKIDKRFGSNHDYIQLVTKANALKLGVIKDIVLNHLGTEHWMLKDLPRQSWLNQHQPYRETHHQRTVLQDPYATTSDKTGFSDGWFVPTMADLNQRDPLLADYLTHNTLWWIESAKLAALRVDTFSYPDKHFTAKWSCRLQQEYPNITIIGEEWSVDPNVVAYWQAGKQNPDGYQTCARSMFDFPLQQAIVNALLEDESQWDKGWLTLYKAIGKDNQYAEPYQLSVMLDNHDMDRITTALNDDYSLVKLAMTYLLTTRGIPQLLYGNETLMSNSSHKGDHGVIRTPWQQTPKTKTQQDYFTWLTKLLNWRKTATAVHTGKLIHYLPQDGVYVYFRYDDSQKFMVILNKGSAKPLLLERFNNHIADANFATDVLTKKQIALGKQIVLPEKSGLILQLF